MSTYPKWVIFLLKMGDFFTEGLCFATFKEGKGERCVGAPPFCEGQSEGRAKKDGKERGLETSVLANVSRRHYKGRGPVGPRPSSIGG